MYSHHYHRHPLEVALQHELAVNRFGREEWVMAALSPEAALDYAIRSTDMRLFVSLLDRRDIDKETRQNVVEKIADSTGGTRGARALEISRIVTGEIYRGRAEFSPKIRDFLRGLFAHYEGLEAGFNTMAPLDSRRDCLTAIAMVFDEKKVPLAPEGMAADIIAKWPKLQAARRNETATLLETGMVLRSSRGVLTFDTPWDSDYLTARPPHPGRVEPWLASPDKRNLPKEWLVSAAQVLARAEGRAQDSVWHGLDWNVSDPKRRMSKYALTITNMPPRNDLVFDEIIREMNRGRRASDLIPLVWAAQASLASEPTKEPARVAAALLSAWQRFPSLQVKWGMLLMLLPLTPETRGLWWDIALTAIKKDGDRFRIVQEAVLAHRMAAVDMNSDLFVPPTELVERYRGFIVNQNLLLLAPGEAGRIVAPGQNVAR